MTTIAYKAGILAGDSAWSDGDTVDTLSTKIFRLRSGALIGFAGSFDHRLFIPMFAGIKNFRQMPSYDDLLKVRVDALGLLVFPNGTMAKFCTTDLPHEHWDGENKKSGEVGAWMIDHDFTAIGTGADVAWGAMAAGASARQSVRIACRRDRNSRLPVSTLFLGGKK